MCDLTQRERHNVKPTSVLGVDRYPDIPAATEFWTGRDWRQPETVHGWQWSTTFGKWSALVTFADGWHGFTYPKPA
jgi:hypothetical protein